MRKVKFLTLCLVWLDETESDLVLFLFPSLPPLLTTHLLHLFLGEENLDLHRRRRLHGLHLNRVLNQVGDGLLPDVL